MGLMRIYLALCVAAGHSGLLFPKQVPSPSEAVQLFYVISGFYMALISSKYTSAMEFYTSRFLRIFIPYWATLIIILSICMVTGLLWGDWMELQSYVTYSSKQNGFSGVFITALTNISIFFQDWVMFLKHDPGGVLSFTPNFLESKNPLWHYLIVPQAWSVGVELTFYLLVPVLTKLRNNLLFILMAISVLLRVFSYEFLGLMMDPWTYRFFPFEIALFITGILSFRISDANKSQLDKHLMTITDKTPYAYFLVSFALFSFIAKMSFSSLGKLIGEDYSNLLFYLMWASFLPFLFYFTHKSKVDRYIGDLSYPIYLVHIFMILLTKTILSHFEISTAMLSVLSIFGSVLLAVVLMKFMIYPFEIRRQVLAKSISTHIQKIIPEFAVILK